MAIALSLILQGLAIYQFMTRRQHTQTWHQEQVRSGVFCIRFAADGTETILHGKECD
jgi:hypothetical protein